MRRDDPQNRGKGEHQREREQRGGQAVNERPWSSRDRPGGALFSATQGVASGFSFQSLAPRLIGEPTKPIQGFVVALLASYAASLFIGNL
jgi:hypothetical protein